MASVGLSPGEAFEALRRSSQHRNVKLAVSGHLHLNERIDYAGVSYLCNGAVSGGWWKGPHLEFPEGYGVIDIHPDGTFEHQYVTYGWVAEKA